MIRFIRGPFGIKIVIAELIFAFITNAVVVFVEIGMKSKLTLRIVRTGGSIPVVSAVSYPSLCVQGVAAKLVCACVANAVVVFVLMGFKVAFYDFTVIYVTAASFVPVIRCVAFPSSAKSFVTAELIVAFVANAVVICVALGVTLLVLDQN